MENKDLTPYSKMPCNDIGRRKEVYQFVLRIVAHVHEFKIGDRLATPEQKSVFVNDGSQVKIRFVPMPDDNKYLKWFIYAGEENTGFYWSFAKNVMCYTTRDGKKLRVTLPKRPEPMIEWEKSGCLKCGKADPGTWHGRCIRCENPGCFLRGGVVTFENGELKKIEDIKIGDGVRSAAGISVVRDIFVRDEQNVKICTIDRRLRLTDTHPIFLNGAWMFPNEVSTVTRVKSETLWNFVMEGAPDEKTAHTVIVDGILCATLGCAPCNRLRLLDPEADECYGTGFWNRYNTTEYTPNSQSRYADNGNVCYPISLAA